MYLRISTAAVFAAALLTGGCKRTPPPVVPVEGVVLINGQPLPFAQVRFIPMFEGLESEYIATGITDEKGRFKLSCPLQDGAAACENRVTIADGPPPEGARGMSAAAQIKASTFYAGLKNRPIPVDLSSVAKTPLIITVTADKSEYEIKLTR